MALTLFNNVSNKTQLNLTLEQQAAVDVPLPTVTLSCAGTGKTTTMIERIKKANEQDGIKLERVFVATFSKYAAQDMTNRLIVRLNNAPQFIGTFHRNCFKLFKKFPILLTSHKYNPDNLNFAAAVDTETIMYNELLVAKNDLEKLGLKVDQVKKTFVACINYLKAKGIYPIDYHGYTATSVLPKEYEEEVYKRLEGTGNILKKAFDSKNLKLDPLIIFWTMFKTYQEILKKANQLDFNDVIALPVFAMRDDTIRTAVNSNFDLIVVDEFQDCSIMQFELIEQLSNGYKTAFLVGDEDQLLYEWRDADLQKVMSFYSNMGFNVKVLEGNFRSQKPIIDLAVNIITQNKDRYASKVMKSMRQVEEENPVIFIQPYDDKFEGMLIARQIKKILANDSGLGEVPANEIAIIFASKYYRNNIEFALKRENIDYNFVKGYGFYEYPEVKKVLSYLTLALNLDNDVSFKDVFNYPKRGNGSSRLNKLEAAAINNNRSLFKELEQNKEYLNYKENKEFVKLIKTLNSFIVDQKTPLEIIGHLQKELDLRTKLSKEYGDLEADDRITRLKQLELALDELLKEFGNYKDAIGDLWEDIFSTPKETLENKVQLMTAFAAKGLEFKVVFIIGAINGNFPSFKEGSTIESSRRVFYVATTRAKDLLVISAPKYYHRSGTVVECAPTMFLDGSDAFYETITASDLPEFEEYQQKTKLIPPSGKKYVDSMPEGFYD